MTTRLWRLGGAAASLLLALAVVGAALALLGAGRGAAQGPAEERSWRAELAPFGGQDLGEGLGGPDGGEVVLRFVGQDPGIVGPEPDGDAFFDIVYHLDVREASGAPLTEAITLNFAFFLGGQEGEELVAIGCDGTALGVAQTTPCAAAGSIRVPASFFLDQFDSFLAALDAEEIVVVVRTTVGDLMGLFIPARFPVMAFEDITASIGLGLTTAAWCGFRMDTNELFELYPELAAVFVLAHDPASGEVRFEAAQRRLPLSVRPNITLEYGMGMFVRATAAFNIGMPPTLTSELPSTVTFAGNQVEIAITAPLQMLANCGPPTTNSAILDGNPGVDRLFTFDNGWTGIGGALPASPWTEVVVPTAGAFLVTTDGQTIVTLPCASEERQSVVCGIEVGSG